MNQDSPTDIGTLTKYIETLNTDKKLMLDLLEANINAVDLMAANMFAPNEYSEFERLMKILIEGYK